MNGRVIVLGGGIGGLCASIALRRAGVDAVVYEQSPRFSEVGAGIQVWVKGMQALRILGVADAVRDAGAESMPTGSSTRTALRCTRPISPRSPGRPAHRHR